MSAVLEVSKDSASLGTDLPHCWSHIDRDQRLDGPVEKRVKSCGHHDLSSPSKTETFDQLRRYGEERRVKENSHRVTHQMNLLRREVVSLEEVRDVRGHPGSSRQGGRNRRDRSQLELARLAKEREMRTTCRCEKEYEERFRDSEGPAR